jgi:hypothetical protein
MSELDGNRRGSYEASVLVVTHTDSTYQRVYAEMRRRWSVRLTRHTTMGP